MGRTRNWLPVAISVLLLIATGVVAILVNRSALRAADAVHRADSRALGVNNTTLAGQLQLLSAAELNDFATSHDLSTRTGDAATRRALVTYAAKSNFFSYGAAITDLAGTVLNATRTSGLPPSTDAGFAPLRQELFAGRPGFSSVIVVNGIVLAAVAVPVLVGGLPVALLIGFNQVSRTQLQVYVSKLSAAHDFIAIVDSDGRIGAATDTGRSGSTIDAAVIASLRTDKRSRK